MKVRGIVILVAAFFIVFGLVPGAWAQTKEIVVGGIFDISGPTSSVGKDYAAGAVDAEKYINQQGGVDGIPIRLIPNDYAYQIPKAQSLYKKYQGVDKVFIIQGWGTGDTNALREFINKDKIVFMSASYDGNLTDPKKTPYNFFIGSSYSDHIRMAMRYAKENGGKKVCFIYPDHPYGKNP
ncbi:MAG: ABC transporter substrate-binding protein, partial [Pseudomonadota bacterium]